jgi:hypothetical protein
MAPRQRTQLLALLLIPSAIAAASGWSSLNTNRANALDRQKDLAICNTELATINVKAATSAGQNTATTDDLAINRRLRGAAIAAHLSDQLSSVDPGAAVRLPDSDYLQTPIYLRLNAVTLRELVSFLYELSSTDNALRTSDIELSPPLASPPAGAEAGDRWTADITLSYLAYAQRPASQ